MNRFRSISGIRWRLIGTIVAVVALGQLAWGLYQADREADQLRSDARANGLALLRATTNPLAVPLANRDITTLDASLNRIAAAKEANQIPDWQQGTPELPLLWIAILDPASTVVAHTEPSHYGENWSKRAMVRQSSESSLPIIREIHSDNGPVLQLALPIESGIRWGTALTEISMVQLESEIRERRRRVLLQSMLLGVIAATLLSLLVGNLVIRPLTHFSHMASRISSGDLSARVALHKPVKELELMSDSFNEMALKIQGQTQLLERQVEARTSELQEVNTALEDAVEKLQEQARTDGLTGLQNHRSFQEAIHLELKRSQRHDQPLSLMMIDVDHFKAYNDNHGHPAGDTVLRTIAQLLLQSLRSTDIVARYGGEEFAALIINSDSDGALAAGTKILEAVRAHSFEGEEKSQPKGRVTVSIGVASFPTHTQDPKSLLEQADQALYSAKHAGRDQIALAPIRDRS